MSTEICPAGACLETWSTRTWNAGIQLEDLTELDVLTVETANTTYEVTVTSGERGEILVRGGRFFPEFTHATLVGASAGGSFVKERGIYIGYRMELRLRTRSILTTEVRSMRLLTAVRTH
jgi:hypothetical protein